MLVDDPSVAAPVIPRDIAHTTTPGRTSEDIEHYPRVTALLKTWIVAHKTAFRQARATNREAHTTTFE